ncbi:hypothetical protein [Chryseobacterium sp.]|uniref:hypothetical protein n=1 Tax=Chryseobacterium sp. TaxID=1871047 RepID=UPI00289796E0|nr:hypothetical protein [Chryseobacterium sp.]
MSVKTNKSILLKILYLSFILITVHLSYAQKINDNISINDFKNQKYKQIFQQNYKFGLKSISIHILQKDEKRKLLIYENSSSSKRNIIVNNDDVIYSKSSECSNDSFNKIVQKNLYFTIEQNFCTNRRGQYLQEYLTFKYNSKINSFLLDKYSFNLVNRLPADDSLPPKSYIEDKFPTETYTSKDFGKIELNNFNKNSINDIREKYLEDK